MKDHTKYRWQNDQRALSGVAAGLYCIHNEVLGHKDQCKLCNPKPIELEERNKRVHEASIERVVGMSAALGMPYGQEQGHDVDEKLAVWKYIFVLFAFTLLAFISEHLYLKVLK